MISENALHAVFTGSLKLRKTESCLIVTDTVKEPIGRAFYDHARGITKRAKISVMDPTPEHGTEPPEQISRLMTQYDVQLLITDKSLTHTMARREATSRGARIASMPSITEEVANRCLDIDYEHLREESKWLYGKLSGVSTVRVVTELGTDMVFRVGSGSFFGREGASFDHPGAFGNLPEGEISFSPESCEGVYIVDATFPELGVLNAPLAFKVRGGVVCEINGERSREVIERLDRVGARAYRVAELGIGLNPKARISGNVLEDEKVIGTIHIAVGNNLSYGGDNDVPLHLDGVITRPDIYLDGVKLMEKGLFIR
ncbi:MAG: aminopeptidase [Candidatus Omnitrophica bacterium]|nr:aminopeptidase [Candidatus Omnitrophota bacterium]